MGVAGALSLDMEDHEATSSVVQRDLLFFRMVALRPKRGKAVELPRASRSRLATGDMCITLHEQVEAAGALAACVDPMGCSPSGNPLMVLARGHRPVRIARFDFCVVTREMRDQCIFS